MVTEPTVDELLVEYRGVLLAMHESRVDAGGDPRRWNDLVNKMQALHLKLRESARGRDGIAALMRDECATVRQWSAANALAGAPQEAKIELEKMVEAGGLGAFEARVTLQEFEVGRLKTDWTPKS